MNILRSCTWRNDTDKTFIVRIMAALKSHHFPLLSRHGTIIKEKEFIHQVFFFLRSEQNIDKRLFIVPNIPYLPPIDMNRLQLSHEDDPMMWPWNKSSLVRGFSYPMSSDYVYNEIDKTAENVSHRK
ncbi:hypothetical protein NPIL_363301 [Nephila pilipes]|uniref:Uncharacterized protein n=1 Tax=Nephila pilipes TaxID=299642 RepID=A0A8X6MJP1_NEPPI|nr:hypothetical protein NPIL_363301 [Nephila pilipes]